MPCILCSNTDLKIVSKRDAKNKGFLNVSFCRKCGMVQQDPIPTDEYLRNYYSLMYRRDYKKTHTPKLKHVFRAGNLAIQRINLLKKSNVVRGTLLDVGAGGGEFTYLSRKAGFKSKGVEPNLGYSEYARKEYGVDVTTGQLSDVVEKFEIITMFHVLEHLTNPLKTFQRVWELLEAKGFLFVEVPNIETNDASPSNIYFKAHIFYFSEATLISAASKYFDTIFVDNSSNIRIIFQKKGIESKLILPTPDTVARTNKRLQQKGWLEYLFKGKGYIKFLSKLKAIVGESTLPHQSGKTVLQNIHKSTLG